MSDNLARVTSRRDRYAERLMLKGRGYGVAVKRPGGNLAVSLGRTRVRSAGGLAVFFPIWLVSRLRWQSGEQTWTVKVQASGRFKTVLSRLLEESTFSSKAEAQAAAQATVQRAREGHYDSEMTSA